MRAHEMPDLYTHVIALNAGVYVCMQEHLYSFWASQGWYGCVDGFLSLLDAVRNLQMQFIALGVPETQFFCLLPNRKSIASLNLQITDMIPVDFVGDSRKDQ